MPSLPPKLIRNQASHLVLTERDKLIIQSVYRFRFLSTDQLQAITGTAGRRALNRRLKELFDAKFLDRPKIQHSLYSHADTRLLIHALGNEGAKLVERLNQIELPKSVRWTDKNNKLKKPEFIAHTLGVADFYISLESALARLPEGIGYQSQETVLSVAPARTRERPNPLSIPTRYKWWKNQIEINKATVADGVFALSDNREGKTGKAFFFLEYDSNTMPIIRTSASQSSIVQKMLGYADIRGRKSLSKYFGYNNFRVLFVTTDRQQRIGNMRKAWGELVSEHAPAGAFLFADYQSLVEQSPFGDVWVNANGESASLVPNFSLN